MSPQTSEAIYKTPPGITPIVLRVLLSIPIILCIINFQVNPRGFTIIMIIFVGLLCFVPSSRIIVKNNCFIVKNSFCVGLVSKKFYFYYDEIEKAIFQDDKIKMSRTLIPVFPFLSGKQIEIFYRNREKFKLGKLHIKWREVQKCRKLIAEKLKE